MFFNVTLLKNANISETLGNMQVETDSSRRRFRTERELERTRIEEEKKKVQVRNVIQKYCPGYT